LLFLGHNFRIRNARKPIKGIKDLDSSLVSNKNLSKKFHLAAEAQGQVTWNKMAKNQPHLWYHPEKNLKSKT